MIPIYNFKKEQKQLIELLDHNQIILIAYQGQKLNKDLTYISQMENKNLIKKFKGKQMKTFKMYNFKQQKLSKILIKEILKCNTQFSNKILNAIYQIKYNNLNYAKLQALIEIINQQQQQKRMQLLYEVFNKLNESNMIRKQAVIQLIRILILQFLVMEIVIAQLSFESILEIITGGIQLEFQMMQELKFWFLIQSEICELLDVKKLKFLLIIQKYLSFILNKNLYKNQKKQFLESALIILNKNYYHVEQICNQEFFHLIHNSNSNVVILQE
ncbi:unnamed protein product [Paramecium pentaurelia]|uniref:Uncharacterized protein n=1 Tax=Paramecium pentaurelia TaxID=43138 RepID=A0A8S1YJW2_9CILI|nr:unnamed protein product [Paramecium pentaurelia]